MARMIKELIAEAERIAKPSLLLSPAPPHAEAIGWWRGGKPGWHAGRADDTHRISAGLERTDYDRAAALEDGLAYEHHYTERSPLYMTDVVAVLGGWHAMWPDDDSYIPREMRLALWTLWDSEPWIEVFERFPNFSVRVRTT
jgi:hypothetical protein